eukprot:6194286-Pleurochrysis_carterae.AAC.1
MEEFGVVAGVGLLTSMVLINGTLICFLCSVKRMGRKMQVALWKLVSRFRVASLLLERLYMLR